MTGYRQNRVPQEAPANVGEAVIDGGNATTNYITVFNNGAATIPAETPVKLDFGAAT